MWPKRKRDASNHNVNVSASNLQLSRLSSWSPPQVSAYLEQQMDMPSKYGDCLQENHISGQDIIDIVREQNHEQLKEIGILAVGHRNRILREFRRYVDSNDAAHDSGTDIKTPEKTKHDMFLDKQSYGPMWNDNFMGVPMTQTVADQKFFEFFSRTRINPNFQRQIWLQCVGEKHACTFEEFVTMMKMTSYVQLGVPPSVLSVAALQSDHPSKKVDLQGTSPGMAGTSRQSGKQLTTIPASASEMIGASSVTNFQRGGYNGQPEPMPRSNSPPNPGVPNPGVSHPMGSSRSPPAQHPNQNQSRNLVDHVISQASHNVMFKSLPQEVLDSDDKLYSLESLALHVFNPIHFEIDGQTLIATFDNDITPTILAEIREKTIQALISMGIETYKVQRVALSIPPPPQDEDDIRIYEGNIVTPDGTDPRNGGGMGYGNPSNGHVPPPPPPPNTMGSPTNQMNGSDPNYFYNDFMRKVNLDAEFMNIRDGKLRTMNVMNILAKLRGVGSSKDVKFNDVAIKELSNLNRQRLEMYLRNITPDKIDILMGRGNGGGASRRGGSQRQIAERNSRRQVYENGGAGPLDTVVNSKSSRSQPDRGHDRSPDPDSREQFVGVVISGLPETITENDDSLLQLDAIVLNDVTVEHIEVVGTTLRITFGEMIAKSTLTTMRKSLRDFLFDNGLQKREVKNVTIAPHTMKTWKGRVTEADGMGSPPAAYGQPQANQYHASALAQPPYQKPYQY